MFEKIQLMYFKKLIGDKKTIEQVLNYCKNNKESCNKHKNYLCKHILKIYGYHFNKKLEGYSCSIFKELLEFAKDSDEYANNYIKMSDDLLSEAVIFGSNKLLKFLEYNCDINESYLKQRRMNNLRNQAWLLQQSDINYDTDTKSESDYYTDTELETDFYNSIPETPSRNRLNTSNA